MFRQKKLNRFLYRNVRAMSLYNTVPTHMGTLTTQSPHTPQHRAHIHVNFEKVKNSKSLHTTTQSPHLGELWKLKVLTRHSTEPTHRGTLKTQSPHTPQHRVYTHGNFKTQSPHTPQHRAHTHGNKKARSPQAPQHREYRQENYENYKS